MPNLISICFAILSLGCVCLAADSGINPENSDPCEFVRQAIYNLPAAGGVILVPSGTYTCRTPVILDRSHLTLRGQGEVTFKLADASNAPILIMGDAATPPKHLQDIEISNIKIDGNRAHQTSECWGGACDSGGTAFIRNNGITVRGLTRGRILNVEVSGARSGGVVTEKGCYDLIIDHLTSVDNFFDGFAGYETSRATLTHLNLSHNQAAGISIDIRFNANTFRDVKLEHNGDVGIFMRDSSFNLFENFQISDNGNHGVFLAQAEAQYSCANENEFSNFSILRSKGFGFRLNDACPGNRMAGTTRLEKNRDGCISEGTSTKLEIFGSALCDN